MEKLKHETEAIKSLSTLRPDLEIVSPIQQGETQSPDFYFTNSKGDTIGIEVTRFNHGGFERAGDHAAILQTAEQYYRAMSGQEIRVLVGFRQRTHGLSKHMKEQAAKSLAKLLFEEAQDLQIGESKAIQVPASVPLVRVVSLKLAHQGKREGWFQHTVGFSRLVTLEELVEISHRKEKRFGAYTIKCCERWLLLTLEFEGDEFNPTLPELAHSDYIPSCFDRYFCIDAMRQHCLEFTCRAK